MARGNDLIDECRPVVRPFLFEDRNENEIELVEESSLALEALF